MKLNPFIKFEIDCPFSPGEAHDRLRRVIKVLDGVKRIIPDCGHPHEADQRRFLGRLNRREFKIRHRVKLKLILDYNFHNVRAIRMSVIYGRIETRGAGCVVKFLIRPMLYWLVGLPLWVGAFLLVALTRGELAGGPMNTMFLALPLLIALFYWGKYLYNAREDKEYFRNLLSGEGEGVTPTPQRGFEPSAR